MTVLLNQFIIAFTFDLIITHLDLERRWLSWLERLPSCTEVAQLVRAPAFLHASVVKVVSSNPAAVH